ncbi:MAG: acyl-CoA-binding protein [Cryomorphaceae bacterium]|nr:acyl-CoA-binding protein [Cryomorphaceae bacterium]
MQTVSPEKGTLDKLFEEYVALGSKMPTQTADNMLIAYGFFKQATEGDNNDVRPTESSNVVQTFKYDAWKRLAGMTKDEAKKRYIKHIKSLIDLSKEEGRM